MAELHIRFPAGELPRLETELPSFAEDMQCELLPVEAGYLLLPEVMLRHYGVFVFPMDGGVRICREEEATSWEDFLMMRLAHTLADRWAAGLYLEGREEPLEVAPEKFATFDHYVETAVARDDELVRDMKKYWLYAHRKRSLR